MVAVMSVPDTRWKPDEHSWSALEIVCHLGDEEVEDFRARLRSVLEDPARAWAPIDPAGWAVQRGYAGMDLEAQLARFERERGASVAWLGSLTDAEWSNAHVHPRFGPISAGHLLGAWAAHDALHLRQLSRRLHQQAGRDADGSGTGYAGSW